MSKPHERPEQPDESDGPDEPEQQLHGGQPPYYEAPQTYGNPPWQKHMVYGGRRTDSWWYSWRILLIPAAILIPLFLALLLLG